MNLNLLQLQLAVISHPSFDNLLAAVTGVGAADHPRSSSEECESENDAIWFPPEAAHISDESDDDDDGGGHSSSSESSDWEAESPREERRRSMLTAMNGQLKMLASRFLDTAGISFQCHGHGHGHGEQSQDQEDDEEESWLDIVTSLSWEAALLIKPDGSTGEDMDPASYIKVKRLASGTRRQCEVIKGLVFKKNAAHKHMATRCHSPRLLLLKGLLAPHSHAGLSSISSMQQEKEHFKNSFCQMLEACSPNVVMVEKTVSREIQELLLKKGVTLVVDMNFNRLQRIARCSSSPILSFPQVLRKPKLKHCDYFHIEKVVEEHNHPPSASAAQGGKKPSKTLMFLEGFSRPLGCTILLRGANSEELKKVKQVIQYTVFAAYQLVLETSFFEDQRVFLNSRKNSREERFPISPTDNAASSLKLHPVTSNGSLVEYTDGETAIGSSINPDSLADGSPHQQSSGSLRSFIDIFRHQNIYLPITSSQETTNHHKEGRTEKISQEMAINDFHASQNAEEPVDSGEHMDHVSDTQKQVPTVMNDQIALADPSVCESSVPLENGKQHSTGYTSEEKTSDIDESDDSMDSQSILILLSSQSISKQVICEQSHLSRIRYYGNFDVSLGRYLQDILQNQNLSCSSCGEPPEAHMYSYTHCNGNLTVLVKRLPPRHRLTGESDRKIWMWTRCVRCQHENGISKSSQRVLMSSEARNLSFGKFLELSFSSHSAARRLSICGHLVNRDCLRFFGLGSKVAMFQYSSVEIYTACKPQPTLEFHNPSTHDWFEQEGRNVLAIGVTLFSEIASVLQHLKGQFGEGAINSGAFTHAEFSQLEEMLAKEKAEFVDSLVKAVDQSAMPGSSVHDILTVNWLYQDLLLELYVWDRRLHQLLECNSAGEGRMGGDDFEKGTVESTCNRSTSDDSIECRSSSMMQQRLGGESSALVEGQAEAVCMQQEQEQTVRRCEWVWRPLQESRLGYRQELEVGCLEKFHLVNSYSPCHLSPLHKQSIEEVCAAHFTAGPGGSVLCVSEEEISSIISRALAISDQRRHLLDAIVGEGESATDTCSSRGGRTMEKSYSFLSEASSSSWSSSDSEASFLSSGSGSGSDDLSSYDSSLLSSSLHPEVSVSVNGGTALKGKYSVICVHANHFHTLRSKCCPSELEYMASLSRCKKWDAQGGKSKAFFAKTQDDRFIIKQIKRTELESFIEFAPDYFRHVYHSLDTGSQTCLAKILGIYQVKQTRHGKEVKIDLMVMENLLFGHKVSRIYDLKGAVFCRYVSDAASATVYLDQNFVEDMRVSPIYIGARTKNLLQRAIWNDTSFLKSVNVMDYSLLVGVDRHKHELVFGIIDYLRQYTWDKQLETWVKASLVVPKNISPTVVSPREYKKRFRSFMTKHFLTVPDDWGSQQQ